VRGCREQRENRNQKQSLVLHRGYLGSHLGIMSGEYTAVDTKSKNILFKIMEIWNLVNLGAEYRRARPGGI
jgi:hypothetical protein